VKIRSEKEEWLPRILAASAAMRVEN